MNEADTRAELIDKQLKDAGWETAGDVRVRREYKINAGEIRISGERTGRLIADYVLIYMNRKLAVVEAKSDEVDIGEGVAQAKLYAQKLCLDTSFAANGKTIYQICHKTGTEGEVSVFPSPQELWQKTFGEADEWLERFNAVPLEDLNGTKQARYYQEIAVNRAVEAIANNQQRILLTLATGTGKTHIAFQVAWKLFKSRWNLQRDCRRQPRILFLADRNTLANQAYLGFGAFNDNALVRIDPKDIKKRGEVPTNGSVFFTIFQTFMSGPNEEPYFGEYERDFFDLVIIDECHRGGANDESTWRRILEHFDCAVHLGLTATPKRTENTDTYAYFGNPVFSYSLKEGIQDGFLTPFKVKRIQTTIDEYLYTRDDEVLEGMVEEGHVYTENEFNKSIEINEREQKRVQIMLKNIKQNEKTIVFCASQAHAATVRDLINREASSPSVDYCVRVTSNDGNNGEIYLKQFQDDEKSIPTILTTSQKLTTGVDVHNVRNIVLLRSINSMIEFKQIIGRGTRVFEGKHYFTILDFVNAYYLFNDAEWDGAPAELEDENRGDASGVGYGEADHEGDDSGVGGEEGKKAPKLVRVRLGNGTVREIKSMVSTHFFVDGRPVSAAEFLKHLFDKIKLPELLGSEEQLREMWASPGTRRELLKRLESQGCSKDDLLRIQELINAKDSDLFDVLAYIAYAKPPVSRAMRVRTGKGNIYNLLDVQQLELVNFVLRSYVRNGVGELDDSKLGTVLEAKYGSIDAAQKQLGSEKQIRRTFIGFQRYLYMEKAG